MGCYQRVLMIVCQIYWLGYLRMHTVTLCSVIHVVPLLRKLAKNVTACNCVFTYDFIVLGLMRYFILILECVRKERGNREWRTLNINGLQDVSSLHSFSAVHR
jgi:hypothetical protein